MNPYRVLNVRRNASPAAIKRAFRARVKDVHPDHGGDIDDFLRVHAAYRVLSEPARRRRYDETGEIEEPAPDTRTARVMSAIAGAFDAAMEHCAKQRLDPAEQDMVGLMRAAVMQRRGKLTEQAKAASNSAQVYRKLLNRFDRQGDGPNIVDELVAARIGEAERMAENAKAEGDLLAEALTQLESYRFRRDSPQRMIMMTGGWSSTGASTITGTW